MTVAFALKPIVLWIQFVVWGMCYACTKCSVWFSFLVFYENIYLKETDTLNIYVLSLLINGKWGKWQIGRNLKIQKHLLNFNVSFSLSSENQTNKQKKLMFGLFIFQNSIGLCYLLKKKILNCFLESFLNCKGKGKKIYRRKKEFFSIV